MNQVGDLVTLAVTPTPVTGSIIYSYVWDFWDGTSTATTAPFVTKVVNIGGKPGSPDALYYTCKPVAIDGQYGSMFGSIPANNPPTILPGASISVNDAYFTYNTQLTVTAIDMDGDSFIFLWYGSNDAPLGGGATVAAGVASGTWTGNGETVIANYPASRNTITLPVSSDRIVTCKVVDSRSGTSSIDFLLRGQTNPSPIATVAAGLSGVITDSTMPPMARIGPGQTVEFSVYTAPMPQHTVSFLWNFNGSLGWSMAPTVDVGVTTVLDNGGYQNSAVRDISAEVVSTGTSKAVIAGVRITAVNTVSSEVSYTDVEYEITLVENTAPTAVTISRVVSNNYVSGVGPITAGDKIEFSGTAYDDNSDLLTYKWSFSQPSQFAVTTAHFWGAKVVYDTTGYVSDDMVQGVLRVFDAMGGTLTTILPTTNIL